MKKIFWIYISCLIVGCSSVDKSQKQLWIIDQGSLNYLNSLQGSEVDVPFDVVAEKTPDIAWSELEHWMFPVFEKGTKFDKIKIGKYRWNNDTNLIYLAIELDAEEPIVKAVRVNETKSIKKYPSPFGALNR